MNYLPATDEKLEAIGLRPIPAPPEPRVRYTEPHLSNVESLALIRGRMFFVSDRTGNLMPPGGPHVGLFREDTRYLSQIELLVNGHPPIVLSATTEGTYANRVELTVKRSVPGEGLDIPVNTVFIHREQILENEGLHDILQIQNFHSEKAHLVIEITYDCDFMDIFQVRGKPAISYHIPRHCHGSHLAMNNTPMPVIAALLGHANGDLRMVTKHYAHLS